MNDLRWSITERRIFKHNWNYWKVAPSLAWHWANRMVVLCTNVSTCHHIFFSVKFMLYNWLNNFHRIRLFFLPCLFFWLIVHRGVPLKLKRCEKSVMLISYLSSVIDKCDGSNSSQNQRCHATRAKHFHLIEPTGHLGIWAYGLFSLPLSWEPNRIFHNGIISFSMVDVSGYVFLDWIYFALFLC